MNKPHPALTPVGEPEPDPSELWLALTSLPRPNRVVPFPRLLPGTSDPVGELRMWPLTQEEQMAANAEADRFTKKLLKDPQQKEQANLGYHHTYSNEVAVQVLFRACRDLNDLKRSAFPSPTAMRRMLTTDEVGVLFANYTTLQQEVGPIVAHMTEEEQEGLILRLQQGGTAFPFDSLSWEQQRILVAGMASRLVSCWMAMSSVGLPLGASSYVHDQVAHLLQLQQEKEALEAEALRTAQESSDTPATSAADDEQSEPSAAPSE